MLFGVGVEVAGGDTSPETLGWLKANQPAKPLRYDAAVERREKMLREADMLALEVFEREFAEFGVARDAREAALARVRGRDVCWRGRVVCWLDCVGGFVLFDCWIVRVVLGFGCRGFR